MKITSDALLAADGGMLTLLGLLDLSAAFDCVDHRIFPTRLEKSFGLTGQSLAWMGSYLEGRKQRVRYNGQLSSFADLNCGVPQGSVLGPLCFVLYTSDVFNIAHQQGCFIHGYADDLQLYQHFLPRDSNCCALSARFSSCMERIRSWMASNRLRLNPSKTEMI